MAWVLDGGPEGYQSGSGRPPQWGSEGDLPHEESAFKKTKIETSTPVTISIVSDESQSSKQRLDKIIRDSEQDYIDPNNEVKNARYYQEITFRKLHQLMEYEAQKGNSRFSTTSLAFGESMIDYLRSKGIKYSKSGSWDILSW